MQLVHMVTENVKIHKQHKSTIKVVHMTHTLYCKGNKGDYINDYIIFIFWLNNTLRARMYLKYLR